MQQDHFGAHDQALTTRIRDGDRRIFTAVFTQLRPELCRYARRFVRSRATAEDLVQDVFLRLWTKRRDLVVRTTLKSYLYTTVRNRALDEIAHARVAHRHYEQTLSEYATVAPQDNSDVHAFVNREHAFLWKLDEIAPSLTSRGRAVLVLSIQHGLTYREIGGVLGIAPDTVRLHLIRARQIVCAALAQDECFVNPGARSCAMTCDIESDTADVGRVPPSTQPRLPYLLYPAPSR